MLSVTPLLRRVPPRWLSDTPTRAARSRALFAVSLHRGTASSMIHGSCRTMLGLVHSSSVRYASLALAHFSILVTSRRFSLSLPSTRRVHADDRGQWPAPAPSRVCFVSGPLWALPRPGSLRPWAPWSLSAWPYLRAHRAPPDSLIRAACPQDRTGDTVPRFPSVLLVALRGPKLSENVVLQPSGRRPVDRHGGFQGARRPATAFPDYATSSSAMLTYAYRSGRTYGLCNPARCAALGHSPSS